MITAFKIGLLGTAVSAVLVLAADPVHAQAKDVCVDLRGQIFNGQGTSPPARCQDGTLPVPKALLDRPVTAKELEELKGRLKKELELFADRKARCAAQHERIEEAKDDSLDALDALADNRKSGRVSRAESRVATKIMESAKAAHAAAKNCVLSVQQRIDELNAILSSQEKLRAEVPAVRVARFWDEQAVARHR